MLNSLQNGAKEEFFRQRTLAEKLCDARTLLNRRRQFRNEPLLATVGEPDLERVKVILDDLEEGGFISDWIIGGGTAVMYYSEVIPTIDIDVFARYGLTSPLAPLTRVYEHLIASYNAKAEGEMIRVGGIYLQFLPADSGNPVDAEAVKHPNIVSGGLRLFGLEYLICSMLQIGSRKYLPRLALIKTENRFDREKLDGLLKKFGLENKWDG